MRKILLIKFTLFLLILLLTFVSSFQNEFDFEFEWNQTEILITNDGVKDDKFGSKVDMKGDICVIGAHDASVGIDVSQGKAYIYQNDGTNWNEIQILTASDGKAYDNFGASIGISNDANFIVIGAPFASIGNNSLQGKVYVFQNNGTNWIETQILVASDGAAYDNFGASIGISNDDSLVFIGAPGATVEDNSGQGKFYIFENNGTNWMEYQIVTASDGQANDNFGSSISISVDDSFLVIGAPFASIGNNSLQGKAYIFQNNATNWIEAQILVASDGNENDTFATSVSISDDSSSIVIGSPQATVGNNTLQGKAYVFQNNGTNWIETQILVASDGQANDNFGSSISISNDFLIIGSPQATVETNSLQGKVYVFQNNGGSWNQFQILISNDGESYDYFGKSVSISGNFSIIGSPEAQVGNNSNQGKTYIFQYVLFAPVVSILECNPLFSSFECYWDEIQTTSTDIEYQITYDTETENWQLIQSPILNDNVLYQIFNSSIYQDITGNVDYSIQIKACNSTTQICGNPSNQIDLTTKIDSVKNLNFTSTSNSIQLNWDYPDVPIINSIPKLDRYLLSYKIQDSFQKITVSVLNSSTSYQINNLESSTIYSISICGCRTEDCYGDDKGDISTIQVQTLQSTSSSSKSISKTLIIGIAVAVVLVIVIILIIVIVKKKKKGSIKLSIPKSKSKQDSSKNQFKQQLIQRDDRFFF